MVGVALAGCATSTGTTLPSGSTPNNSGGNGVNSTVGLGIVPPPGVALPLYIDNGSLAPAPQGPYVGFNTPATDTQSPIQALTDVATPGLPPPPPSPAGPTDAGSHQVAVAGSNQTQVTLRYTGTVPNLTYQFGAFGNSSFFNYSNIVAHFWVGQSATGTVTIGGTPRAGDVISIKVVNSAAPPASATVSYTVTAADTTATIATALANLISADPTIGNRTASGVFATAGGAAGASVIRITAVTPGVAGNTIVVTSSTSAGATETVTPPGAQTLAGGLASGTLGAPTSWSIELVGNGSNAGAGAAANTYDVRVTCAGTPGPTGKFVCGTLPAYGAIPVGSSPNTGQPTYTPPATNPVFANPNGAFTPINPQMYVILNYGSSTNPASAQTVGIDYIYATQ
ncbi:MAG: hypothetical protein GIW95_10045 [Candidatus Eremiobacteraeota bacterium]|nr:hypothetical protein [Candidatus Eremiobacteraeota bacterium]